MPVPGILKSKAFWTFSTFTGAVSSCVAYDRYQSHLLLQHYLNEASEYGRQPLPHHHQPRCISIFLLAKDADHRKAIRDAFKTYAVDILTVAGLDYKFVVEVDGEGASGKWDEMARESNKPELMLEDKIALNDLKNRVLKHKLIERAGIKAAQEEASEDPTEFLWNGVRTKSSPLHLSEWPQGSDGFLALDPFTFESLQSALKEISAAKDSETTVETVSKKSSSWFWSKSSQAQSPPQPQQQQQLRPLFPVPVYFIPCDQAQSLSARLSRFLFRQHHLTRQIGEPLLELIREQPSVVIHK